MAMNSPAQSLEEKDLSVILEEINGISPDKIINFGLQLKNITLSTIKEFEIRYNRNMSDCLREILYYRLNQEIPLTWLEIVKALRAKSVMEGKIAQQIESKYIQLSQHHSNDTSQQHGLSSNECSEYKSHSRSLSDAVQMISPLPKIKQPRSSPVMRSRCVHLNKTEPSSLSKFIDHVERAYRSCKVETSPLVIKWPHTPSKVFINLACIDRQTVTGKSNSYKEVTEAMVRDGNVDAINATKGPIEFSEVASKISIHSNTKKRLVLVEGAPGVGKSTFAWQYCREWEKGDIGQHYQLVLPHSSREDKSVFMMLVSGKLLPFATIIVTSRPWATKAIRLNHGDCIYQHIEILGFTSDQVTDYIESTIPQHMVSELVSYLKRYPQIRAGMYIPLNSAIVVGVYQENHENGWAMPTTLTELYTAIVRTLLVRYFRAHSQYNITCIQTFQDLPEVVYKKFCILCKLAYGGFF